MKKLILLLLTFNAFQLGAQNNFVGFKSGVTITNISTSGIFSESDNRIGYIGGLCYEFILNEHFSVGSEILYDQRGFTDDMFVTDDMGHETDKKVTIKFNYDYISVPIKTGYRFGKKFYGFSNVAVIPSILADATTILPTLDAAMNVIGSETINVTKNVTKFDCAGLIEIGGGYKLTDMTCLFLSFGFQNSFLSITNTDYLEGDKIYHYGMALNVGLKYALTKD
ncbi:MAG: outer membrane beta-barrel protein [Bacteroidota bacterium]